jgi:anti-sigma B factor antagonist
MEADQGGGQVRGEADLSTEELIMITSSHVGGAVVLSVEGELDAFTAPKLQAAVTAALAGPDPVLVVVDLSLVEFLASSGIGALVEAHRQAAQQREPLRVVVDHSRPVIRALTLSGMDRVLVVHRDVASALSVTPDDGGVDLG